jgi:predicted nucleic acid-binding protein
VSAFDFDFARRWARFDPTRTLARRQDDALPFVSETHIGVPFLLLDTCVYIDQLHGRTPEVVDRLVEARPAHHSTAAVQELMHAVGALDPDDPRSAGVFAQIRSHIAAMKGHRIAVPDADVSGRAGLLSGMLCRLQGYAADARFRALQDCIIFLQAQKLGLTVLTANIGDFDFLLQLIPNGRVLFYRRT